MQCGPPETFNSGDYHYGSEFENYPPQALVHKVSGDINSNYFGGCRPSTQAVEVSDNMYDQSVMKVFNAKKLYSYTTIMCNLDENGVGPKLQSKSRLKSRRGYPHLGLYTKSAIFSSFHDGNRAPIVYVQGRGCFDLAGFYLWVQDTWGGNSSLTTHAHPPKGMFTTINTIFLHVVSF